jgi:hypothetical protein
MIRKSQTDNKPGGLDGDGLVTEAELAECGLTPADVRCPAAHAVEYTALDGSPCWRREDLAEWLDGRARP